MKKLIVISLFLLLAWDGTTQQTGRYLFKEYRDAIEKQTRSYDGSPGVNYWQNATNYTIRAEFFPDENMIRGHAGIEYLNNSPDTLSVLVFNIYQDIFRKGNSRDWDVGDVDLHQGTQIEKLIINNFQIDTDSRRSLKRSGTKLIVPAEILPHSENRVELEWSVQIPATRTVRMGRYSDSIAFLAYWYPQIAVYDDLDGWDMISYGGSVEFYNEFGDYDVQLTLPGNYVVWATGVLDNPEEVFKPLILDRYQRAWQSDEKISIISREDYINDNVTIDKEKLTWRFKADQVPDFSFGAALGFNWDAVSLVVDAETGRRTLTDAVYPDGAINYDQVTEYARKSILYMSEVMPGLPFPYPQMTNFCNGRRSGGMETPMMANNSAPEDEPGIFGLTFHEIAHSYFPFMMGTNEKKHAWMDEGWASLWPHVLVDSLFPDYNYVERSVQTFINHAGSEMDIPPMVPNHLLGADYAALRISSYVRPAMAFHFLENALGTALFLKALHVFMREWEGKHPMPLDFFNTFERVTNARLDWFILPWFYESAYPDLAIHKYTRDRKLVISNVGGLPLPIELLITFTDDSTIEMQYPTSIWQSGERQVVIDVPGSLPVKEIRLGSKRVPDVGSRNNILHIID